jgi:hypothetical protein
MTLSSQSIDSGNKIKKRVSRFIVQPVGYNGTLFTESSCEVLDWHINNNASVSNAESVTDSGFL